MEEIRRILDALTATPADRGQLCLIERLGEDDVGEDRHLLRAQEPKPCGERVGGQDDLLRLDGAGGSIEAQTTAPMKGADRRPFIDLRPRAVGDALEPAGQPRGVDQRAPPLSEHP